jgi:hypothetical protein
MSVLRARIVVVTGRDEYSILRNYPGEALAAFTAGLARQLHQGVKPEPVLGEPAHTYVSGDKRKKTVRATFAKKSIWVVEPAKNKVVEIPENARPNRFRFVWKRILRGAKRLRARFSVDSVAQS